MPLGARREGWESENCSVPGAVLWWRDGPCWETPWTSAVRRSGQSLWEPLAMQPGVSVHHKQFPRGRMLFPWHPAPGSWGAVGTLGVQGGHSPVLSEHSRRMLMREVGAALISAESEGKVGPCAVSKALESVQTAWPQQPVCLALYQMRLLRSHHPQGAPRTELRAWGLRELLLLTHLNCLSRLYGTGFRIFEVNLHQPRRLRRS